MTKVHVVLEAKGYDLDNYVLKVFTNESDADRYVESNSKIGYNIWSVESELVGDTEEDWGLVV